jgi:hypothetical protein
MDNITAKIDSLRSYGEVIYYNLSNGYTAVVKNSKTLGLYVDIIIDERNVYDATTCSKYPSGNWYYSDLTFGDTDSLPKFAKKWLDKVGDILVVRPLFLLDSL